MKVPEVNKGDLIYQAEGWALYDTEDSDVQIMEWEDPCAGKLAWTFHELLKRHALSTNAIARVGSGGIIIKRLELIGLTVVVKSTTNNTELSFIGQHGTALTKKEAERVPGAKPSRLSTMEDVTLHTARSLRAHLAAEGHSDLELHLRFGVEPGGACLLQVPDPLSCSFGSTDYESICSLLA